MSRTTPEAMTTRYVLTVAITAPKGADRISPLMSEPPVHSRVDQMARRGMISSSGRTRGKSDRPQTQMITSGT